MDAKALRAALEVARRGGARAAEAFLETSAARRVSSGDREEREGEPSSRLAVRAWLDGGRLGEASGSPSAAAALVEEALGRARSAPVDPQGGPAQVRSGVQPGLGILDRRIDQLGAEDRAEVVAEAERELRAAGRGLRSLGFSLEQRRIVRRFANTRDLALEEASSVFTVRGGAATDGPDGELSLGSEVRSRSFATVASLPHGADLARRLAELAGPAVRVEGPVRVVLPPLAVARLVGWLAEGFRPAAGGAPEGFLFPRSGPGPGVDRRLHLQDDGSLPGGLRTGSFDERGVPPAPVVLIREGRPEGLLLDPESARRRGSAPTGHVGPGGLRPSNLLLRAGTRSVSAVLSELGGRTLWLDDLDPSGADRSTGELDAVVHAAVLDAGRPVGAARRLRLRGWLAEVLSSVVEVCSDTDRVGHVDAPALVVEGLRAG